jgi:hypothetical protein
MKQGRRPRGFFGKRLYQLQHAPRPVFRAVLASGGSALIYTLIYLARHCSTLLVAQIFAQRRRRCSFSLPWFRGV